MELSQRLDLGALDLADDTDAAEAQDTLTRLAELVEEVAGVEIAPETGLGESGVSSLDRIELAVRIEDAFGVPIDERGVPPGTPLSLCPGLGTSSRLVLDRFRQPPGPTWAFAGRLTDSAVMCR